MPQSGPAISSGVYNASTGKLTVTGTNFTTSAADYNVTALMLTGEGGITSPLTGGSAVEANPTSTTFIVDLSAADQLAIDGLFNNNGTSSVDGTTYNLAPFSFSFDNTDAISAVTVSNALAPSISSVSFNGAAGVLTLAGTGFENEGSTGGLRLGDFTFQGQGGATYTLGTANAAVTSETAATITLAGADLTHVKALFDQNGTTSSDGTTYNLAATTGWDSDAGAAITTEAVTVSSVPGAAIGSAAYDASTGKLTVTGIKFTTSAADYNVTALTLTGEGGPLAPNSVYTLTGGSIEANPTLTTFIVDLSAAEQLAIDGLFDKNGASSVDGTTYNLAATSSFDIGGIADTTSGVTVSNALTPTISSVAFNATTGVLTLSGTGFENKGGAAGLRLGFFTLTGQGGVTYTLGAANAAVTSETAASITLFGAVRALFNADGTTSSDGTTYNLAATAGWDSDTGAAITTEGVTVSLVPPLVVAESMSLVAGATAIGTAAGATATGTAGTSGTGALAGDSDPHGETLSVSAVDGGTVGSSVTGNYGHLTLNADGSYTYVADIVPALAGLRPGSPVFDVFQFTVSDTDGASAATKLTFTIKRPVTSTARNPG
jgi:VCBS repeat-containing protein